jgi:hypothetical protein
MFDAGLSTWGKQEIECSICLSVQDSADYSVSLAPPTTQAVPFFKE